MHEFKHLKQHIRVLISKEQFEKAFYFPRIRLLEFESRFGCSNCLHSQIKIPKS